MVNPFQIFKHPKFKEIRGLLIDGNPWFVGKDVAVALGYGNPRQALKTNVDDEDKGVHSVDTLGGKQTMTVINESGLYSLIFSSKMPEAKEFKRWVTNEVLPSIRKTGSYFLDAQTAQLIPAANIADNEALSTDDTRVLLLEIRDAINANGAQGTDMRSILLEVLDTVNSAPDMQEIFGELCQAFQKYAQTRQRDRDIECGKALAKMVFAVNDKTKRDKIADLATNLLLGEKIF